MVSANSVRGYLRSLARRRQNKVVTVDDANRFLDNQNVRGKARTLLISEVFPNQNAKGFEAVGKRPSARPVARRRLITEWRYQG